MSNRLIFMDTETTGLGPRAEIWELAAIVRDADDEPDPLGNVDREYLWQLRPDLTHAEPQGLIISGYYDRGLLHMAPPGTAARIVHPNGSGMAEDGNSIATNDACIMTVELAQLLNGATIVGAVPWFDDRHISRLLRQHGQVGTQHYHLVDVETLAAGRLGLRPPWVFDDLLQAYGLKYDEADRHTALGDARMVRDLYDAVYHDARPEEVSNRG